MLKKQTKFWTTKTGNKIRICDMSDSHLDNTIKMLERGAKARHGSLLNFYTFGPMPQGEMAQDCFDQEFDRLLEAEWTDFLHPLYDNLIQEQQRRIS